MWSLKTGRWSRAAMMTSRSSKILLACSVALGYGLAWYFGLLMAADSLPIQALSGQEPVERHLQNIRQLTSGRQNAEAYFSFDGRRLIFQSTRDGRDCYQQYIMTRDGGDVRMVSTGQGATT